MTRYFIAANIWLVVAVAVILGRTTERTDPTMYSVFHGGQWFYPGSYTLIVLALIAISVFFFVLTWKTRTKT